MRKPVLGVSESLPGLKQTEVYKHRRLLETGNFGFRKKRNCTIQVQKTKALISLAVTAKPICAFVFSHKQKPGFLICYYSAEKEILTETQF